MANHRGGMTLDDIMANCEKAATTDMHGIGDRDCVVVCTLRCIWAKWCMLIIMHALSD